MDNDFKLFKISEKNTNEPISCKWTNSFLLNFNRVLERETVELKKKNEELKKENEELKSENEEIKDKFNLGLRNYKALNDRYDELNAVASKSFQEMRETLKSSIRERVYLQERNTKCLKFIDEMDKYYLIQFDYKEIYKGYVNKYFKLLALIFKMIDCRIVLNKVKNNEKIITYQIAYNKDIIMNILDKLNLRDNEKKVYENFKDDTYRKVNIEVEVQVQDDEESSDSLF